MLKKLMLPILIISIVVQLNSPYEEVYIINIKIMNHLISYSLTTKDTYETTHS